MSRPHVLTLMQRACARGILVPAFNACYLPMLKEISRVLRRCNAFGLVEVSRPDVEKFGARSFRAVAETFRRDADPDCTGLHLDHVPAVDEDGFRVDWRALIEEALALGYESVMIDGSRLPLEENIAVTRQTADLAHPAAAVEAELGAVLGHEAGPLPPYEELFASRRGFTDPAEAQRFARESGADWISVAAGNIHGAISGAAKDRAKVAARLHIDHLRTLAGVVRKPLVLHGGSGIPHSILRQAATAGIAKINIATEIRQPYERALAEGRGEAAALHDMAARVEDLVVRAFGLADSLPRLMDMSAPSPAAS